MSQIYQHAPEQWDEKKCAKAARRVARDGCGTRYPWPGYIGNHFGVTRYNGGCTRDGERYRGEDRPLPIVAAGYRIVRVPTWGYRIVKD